MYSRSQLLTLLDDLGIAYNLYEHEAVMTIAESKAVRNGLRGVLCKCLLLADRSDRLYLVAAFGDTRLDMRALADQLQSGRLSFAPVTALKEFLGLEPGSASLFGLVNDVTHRVTPIIQKDLLETEEDLFFHPLVNTASVGLSSEAILRFLQHTGHTPIILGHIGSIHS